MFDPKAYFNGRQAEREAFIRRAAGPGYRATLLVEDMASRRYFRVCDEGRPTLVLMEAIPDHTGAFTPGHKLSDYIRINQFLRGRDIRVPEIYAFDGDEGYVLLEDFGDESVSAALSTGADPHGLYTAAGDILRALRDHIALDEISLPNYYDTHIHAARRRIVDWYVPATRRERNGDDLAASYLAAWDEVEAALPPCPNGFVHGDFHVQNLMRLSDGTLGVLDFQGAMWGPLAYDLVNLLEDMRYDVPANIRADVGARYGGGEGMAAWFRVLGTQFHCRMLGQVIRLALIGGKPSYLSYIPRLQAYVRAELSHPVLAPLAAWFAAERIDLDATGFSDLERFRALIRPDAV